MPKNGSQPRLLTAVMEAIANLKEGRGSTQKKIIDRVQCLLSANNMTFRNPAVHIKKALRHGVQTGLIKHKGGKFKLGLDTKDYAIFKSFQKLKKKKGADLPLREVKRGRKRRRKRSRRRRRRRRRGSMDKTSPDEYASLSGSASESITGTPEPADKGRRRKKRRRRRRGRRRTEEGEWSSGHASSEAKDISPTSSNELARAQAKSERDRDRDRDRERNRETDDEHCDGNKY